jgi:hypothetical protein
MPVVIPPNFYPSSWRTLPLFEAAIVEMYEEEQYAKEQRREVLQLESNANKNQHTKTNKNQHTNTDSEAHDSYLAHADTTDTKKHTPKRLIQSLSPIPHSQSHSSSLSTSARKKK